MNKISFLEKISADCMQQRPTCLQCRKAIVTCYCHQLKPFQSPIDFVILQHPKEARSTVATARMAHLSITNSKLIVAKDFSKNAQVNALIADETKRHFVLYPGPSALPLEQLLEEPTRIDFRPMSFWVLDGKWAQIPKMLRLSPNVRALPMVKFSPNRESQFEIREQPRLDYLSTIETIHFVIDSFVKRSGRAYREHHALLEVFQYLVRQQVSFVDFERDSRHRIAKLARAARRAQRAGRTADF